MYNSLYVKETRVFLEYIGITGDEGAPERVVFGAAAATVTTDSTANSPGEEAGQNWFCSI